MPMPRQSSKTGASKLRVEMAEKRLSGTNWKRPSNCRSLRRTSVMALQALRVASSGFLGTHSGTAKRGVSPPITIVGAPCGC